MRASKDITDQIRKHINNAQQSLEDIKYLVNNTRRIETQQILDPINRIHEEMRGLLGIWENSSSIGSNTSGEKDSESGQYPNRSDSPVDPVTQRLCGDYNAGIEKSLQKQTFMQHYQPIRVSVVNAMERRRNASIGPDFQTASDGDYYLVQTNGKFAAVPRFDLTLQESSYGPGAMGEVFDCLNYNSQLRYRCVKVERPAIFESDPAKQGWMLLQQGELKLGQEE